MRRWLTILVFVLALAVPAFAQQSSTTTQQTQQQQSQPAQTTSSGTKQTTTTTTTSKTSTPTEVTRTTGVDPLWLAIGGIALITIIAIALLAMRSRRGRDVVAVRESKTVVRE